MKGMKFMLSALVLAGLGFGTPTLAQINSPDQSPIDSPKDNDEMEEMVDMMVEGIEEGRVTRVSDTSIFPNYDLIIVSGPEDRYYTFYTQNTEGLEVGDTVYLSGNQLYLDDDAERLVAMNYEMASEQYYTRAANLPIPETVVEERRVETTERVIIERPPVQSPAVVETQQTTPVRAMW